MRDDHFLHCRDCDTVFRPSPYDRTPVYLETPDGVVAAARDDCMAFLARHARHTLRTLRPTGQAVAHEGPLWDPMVVSYWQVSDGADTAVVQAWREHVGEPLRYRLVPGRLVAERLEVEVPEEAIREEVDRALFPGTAPERKLAAFVEAFKRVVWDLDPEALEVLYDLPGDPSLSVASLPAPAIERLRLRARAIFDPAEGQRIECLLAAASEDPDRLTVLVRRHVRVEA
jgi:hypothetical protein